jgi:hypothetical protein
MREYVITTLIQHLRIKTLWRWKYLMNLATATMADNSTVNDVRIMISSPRVASGTTTWSCLTHHHLIRGQGTAKPKRRKSEFWSWRGWNERWSTGERRFDNGEDALWSSSDSWWHWGRPRELCRRDVVRLQPCRIPESVGASALRTFSFAYVTFLRDIKVKSLGEPLNFISLCSATQES